MAGAFKPEQEVFIKGIIKWCKHIRPDSEYDKWSVVMYIEGEELEKVRMLQGKYGIKNSVKMDDDGWFITLSRKTFIKNRGRDTPLEPPKVFRVDGDTKIPITELVGNGSTGVAKCILWSSRNFPGHNLRWSELRVDNLVPYTSESYPDKGESLKTFDGQEPLF